MAANKILAIHGLQVEKAPTLSDSFESGYDIDDGKEFGDSQTCPNVCCLCTPLINHKA